MNVIVKQKINKFSLFFTINQITSYGVQNELLPNIKLIKSL
jgi:hypothetical protein